MPWPVSQIIFFDPILVGPVSSMQPHRLCIEIPVFRVQVLMHLLEYLRGRADQCHDGEDLSKNPMVALQLHPAMHFAQHNVDSYWKSTGAHK